MTRIPMGSYGDGLTDTYLKYVDERTNQGEGTKKCDLTCEELDSEPITVE